MSVQPMASHSQSIAPQQPAAGRSHSSETCDRSWWPVARDPILLNLDLLFPPSGRRRNAPFLPRLRRPMNAVVRQVRRTFRHTFHGSARLRGSERRGVGGVGAARRDEAHGAAPTPLVGGALEQQIDRLSQVVRSFESAVAELKASGRAIPGANSNGHHREFAHGRVTSASRRSEEQESVFREILETNLALRQVEAHARKARPKPFAQPVPAEVPSAIGNEVALSAPL